MALTTGQRIAAAVQDAWALVDEFSNRTQLINHIRDIGHGFNRQKMFDIIGNIWERSHAPIADPGQFRYDLVPKDFMAELKWNRDETFGVMGYATYEDELGNPVLKRTVFWTDNYAKGLEYEEEWGMQVAEENRYPGLRYLGFDVQQVWHKKGADYGHPMLQEL